MKSVLSLRLASNEKEKPMIRLSSNFTLFYKIFLPVFFMILYGLFTVFLFFTNDSPLSAIPWVKYSNLIFYLAVLLIMYKSIFQLYRVDCSHEEFIVTNYRTAYKYSYDSIESFNQTNFLLFTLATIRFKSPSSFGSRVSFLLDKNGLKKVEEAAGDVFSTSV